MKFGYINWKENNNLSKVQYYRRAFAVDHAAMASTGKCRLLCVVDVVRVIKTMMMVTALRRFNVQLPLGTPSCAR